MGSPAKTWGTTEKLGQSGVMGGLYELKPWNLPFPPAPLTWG